MHPRAPHAVAATLLLAAGLLGCTPKPTPASLASTPAHHIVAAADPNGLWPAKRFVRFDMVVRDGRGKQISRETILLDRRDGLCRYEVDAQEFVRLPFADPGAAAWQTVPGMTLPSGRLVALVNVRTNKGEVYINNRPQVDSLVGRSLQRIDHASRWLLLPLLVEAPDARFQPVGPTRLIDGSPANEVSVRLGEPASPVIPPGPGSDWRLMLAPDTGRILRTQIATPDGKRTLGADWLGQTEVEGIAFYPERRLDDGRQILFDRLSFPRIISPRLMEDPSAPTPQ